MLAEISTKPGYYLSSFCMKAKEIIPSALFTAAILGGNLALFHGARAIGKKYQFPSDAVVALQGLAMAFYTGAMVAIAISTNAVGIATLALVIGCYLSPFFILGCKMKNGFDKEVGGSSGRIRKVPERNPEESSARDIERSAREIAGGLEEDLVRGEKYISSLLASEKAKEWPPQFLENFRAVHGLIKRNLDEGSTTLKSGLGQQIHALLCQGFRLNYAKAPL